MIQPEKLKSFLDALVKDPSLKMLKNRTTYCNIGIMRAASLFQYPHFFTVEEGKERPMTAREVIAAIETYHDDWLLCSGKQASDYAARGGWGIAFMKVMENGKPAAHDHVATVYPAPLSASVSLKRDVPMVANIGETNGVMRSSQAFPVAQGEASYAILVG